MPYMFTWAVKTADISLSFEIGTYLHAMSSIILTMTSGMGAGIVTHDFRNLISHSQGWLLQRRTFYTV